MEFPSNLRYTRDHEWASYDEDEGIVTVGITHYAVEKIGDVTHVELPEEGEDVEQGKPFAEIEHHKGVDEVYSPVTGRIVEVNDFLSESPEVLNEDPYEEGWLIKVEPDDISELEELMDAEEYAEYVADLEEEEEE